MTYNRNTHASRTAIGYNERGGADIERDIAVSVIIPVYNAEPYLRQCLDSVVNQTLRDIEILCVDDGSTDGSPAILRDYQARDDRIRIFTQENLNAGAARNRGLDLAKGDYLSFLDADDFFEPEMLERAYARAEVLRAEVLVFRCDNYHDDEGRYSDRNNSIEVACIPEQQPFPGTVVKGNLFLTFVGWAWDKLFSREYVQKNGLRFQEQRTTNDLYFTYFALAKAQRIVTMDELFAHHRMHVSTSLEATRDKSWDCFYKALCALRDGLRREGLYGHYEQDFVNYCVSFSLWNLKTISWPRQEVLFYMMKNAWLSDLGVTGREETFFENPYEYREICEVLNGEYDAMFPEGELVQRYRAENAALRKEITELHASVSFRLGRAITYLPRRIRGSFLRR